MIKKIIHLILVAMLASAAMAQDVSVRADHPDEYVVVKGDTLWDIAGIFLEKPWQWPAIWRANPQVANPHLIYPGDVLSLVYIDGQPQLMVNGGKPTVRLSPEIHRSPREAIPPVEWAAIEAFVTNTRVLPVDETVDLPYVVANESERHNATERDVTYVRGIDGRIGEEFAIVRKRFIFYDEDDEMKRGINHRFAEDLRREDTYPDNFWNATMSWRRMNPPILGIEYWDVAEARLIKQGDPAILKIDSDRAGVKVGDYILPVDDHVYPAEIYPHAMATIPEGLKVVALTQSRYGEGHYQIVVISGGSAEGVEPGHVFSAFRPGKRIQDEVKYPTGSWADEKTLEGDKVTLPDQYSAHVLVFRVFDNVSYAMIMDGKRPVREGDVLKHPDDTI